MKSAGKLFTGVSEGHMNEVLFWLLLPYDALVATPYFWVKVVFGIATGLFIRSTVVGLLVCALGNAALFVYSSKHGALLPPNLIALLMWSIFAFVGVVWWVVGRILRWGKSILGIKFSVAVAMVALGLWLLALALAHIPVPEIPLLWLAVRIFWIVLAVVAAALALFGLHILSEDRFSLLRDKWGFRGNSR
jgi:hypothetical protein